LNAGHKNLHHGSKKTIALYPILGTTANKPAALLFWFMAWIWWPLSTDIQCLWCNNHNIDSLTTFTNPTDRDDCIADPEGLADFGSHTQSTMPLWLALV
jgi:hypothetical protein